MESSVIMPEAPDTWGSHRGILRVRVEGGRRQEVSKRRYPSPTRCTHQSEVGVLESRDGGLTQALGLHLSLLR